MYRSSPFRSTLNTGYITGLDMCKVCTEAVHSVALWTRVTLQVWTCVKYIPKQSIAQRFEHLCKCKRMSSSPPHPTPPYPMWCVRGWLWVGKWCKIVPVCTCDSSLCARVTLENGCVRTWLQSVCAGDSGWKKWCKIVPVCTCDSRVCARVTPWPFGQLSDCQCIGRQARSTTLGILRSDSGAVSRPSTRWELLQLFRWRSWRSQKEPGWFAYSLPLSLDHSEKDQWKHRYLIQYIQYITILNRYYNRFQYT